MPHVNVLQHIDVPFLQEVLTGSTIDLIRLPFLPNTTNIILHSLLESKVHLATDRSVHKQFIVCY